MEYTKRTITKTGYQKDKGFCIVRYTTTHTRETLTTAIFLFRVRLTPWALITLLSYCEAPYTGWGGTQDRNKTIVLSKVYDRVVQKGRVKYAASAPSISEGFCGEGGVTAAEPVEGGCTRCAEPVLVNSRSTGINDFSYNAGYGGVAKDMHLWAAAFPP